MLPKMGVTGKLPLVFRYAPLKFQGLSMMQIHVHIIIEQLKLFLSHGGHSSQLGLTYTASVEAMQVEVGSLTQFFQLDFNKYGLLTPDSWLSKLWRGLWKYGISLRPGRWHLHAPRVGDRGDYQQPLIYSPGNPKY